MTELIEARRPFINGAFHVGQGSAVPVVDPATELPVAEVEGASEQQFLDAVLAARAAFDCGTWSDRAAKDRIAAVGRFADALEARRDLLVETTIAETGCPRMIAELGQVGFALANIRQFADLYGSIPSWEHNEVPLELLAAGPRTRLSIRSYEPVGVVAAITAYNGPLLFSVWKAIPALLAGCTAVVRPSPITPLVTMVLGEAALEAELPAGALNVLAESGSAGAELLTTHPAVDAVSFTGSVGVGRMVAQQAAATMKRLTLELGGKSVQLHLPDVVEESVDSVVGSVIGTVSGNAGQACVLQSRVLVPEDVKGDLLEALADALPKITMGDPRDSATQMGPLVTQRQRDRVAGLVEEGIAAGGRLVTGGRDGAVPDKGWFFAPTVVAVDDNTNPLARTEVFGPVVTVQGYTSVDEAIAVANDTEFGLSNGVYTNDVPAGLAIAGKLRSGAVHVNERAALGIYTPMGGFKQSGIGRERGVEGIRAFQEIKHVIAGPA